MSIWSALSFDTDVATEWYFEQASVTATERAGEGGSFAMVERAAPEGAMPPLYSRDEDETYRVLDGDVTFFIDGEAVEASAGDVVVAPAGLARTWRVDSDDARWLVMTRVMSLQRFEDFSRAVAYPLDDEPPSLAWLVTQEAAALASMAKANGIQLLGPPGALPESA